MTKPYPDARYLGRKVYAQINPETQMLVLTTGTHKEREAPNVVYMSNDEVIALKKFIADVKASQQ